MTVRDHWVETLKCPQCGKTGLAELSMASAESWVVQMDSIPRGFKAMQSGSSSNFYCASCDRAVEP